jgi:hypothetical protein
VLAVVLASGVAAGVAVALAASPDGGTAPRPAAPSQTTSALPAPGAALPRSPAPLAAALADVTRRLRAGVTRWRGVGPMSREVTYLALYQQRVLRLLAARRALGDATLALLPQDVVGMASDTVLGRRSLAAIPRSPGRPPPVRVATAAPAADLRRDYATAERRFGIAWFVLASINFVESAFGRVRSASAAGARGPMQFLPATWREFGMGGDIESPRDAILAAANFLRRAGATRSLDRALFAYNPSTAYVAAIRRFAHAMAVDPTTFLSYYAWQVFAQTPHGVRRLTGPGRP